MDIGEKIRQARVNANFTQEQVAEALGISRQTVSNWENEKTYPDIISVIKLSDLYQVSLDYLLKGERPMPNYLEYLQESTDTVKSNERRAKNALILFYLSTWVISFAFFWGVMGPADGMAYTLIFLWGLLPLTTCMLSLLIGINNYWGRWKWASAVAFGIMYMLIDYMTFPLANTVATGNLNLPKVEMILLGAIYSVLGLALGNLIRLAKQKLKESSYH